MARRTDTDASRDLLLGLLALQNGLIDQVQLVAAFETWTHAQERSLAEILAAQLVLDQSGISFLKDLVTRHLEPGQSDLEEASLPQAVSHAERAGVSLTGQPQHSATVAHRRSDGSAENC